MKENFIEVKEGMTRINVKIHSSSETELNGLGPIIQETDIKQLYEQLSCLKKDDLLIISGSIPHGLSTNIYEDILAFVSQKDIKVVIDATGELLMSTLKYHPLLIKPNHHELAEIFQVEIHSLKDIEYYARKLQFMGAKNVLISMSKDGSLLIDENSEVHTYGVFKGKVKNSVGAGDSMVAGFVAGYLEDKNYKEILVQATACGSATAFSYGLAKREEIISLMRGEK